MSTVSQPTKQNQSAHPFRMPSMEAALAYLSSRVPAGKDGSSVKEVK